MCIAKFWMGLLYGWVFNVILAFDQAYIQTNAESWHTHRDSDPLRSSYSPGMYLYEKTAKYQPSRPLLTASTLPWSGPSGTSSKKSARKHVQPQAASLCLSSWCASCTAFETRTSAQRRQDGATDSFSTLDHYCISTAASWVPPRHLSKLFCHCRSVVFYIITSLHPFGRPARSVGPSRPPHGPSAWGGSCTKTAYSTLEHLYFALCIFICRFHLVVCLRKKCNNKLFF